MSRFNPCFSQKFISNMLFCGWAERDEKGSLFFSNYFVTLPLPTKCKLDSVELKKTLGDSNGQKVTKEGLFFVTGNLLKPSFLDWNVSSDTWICSQDKMHHDVEKGRIMMGKKGKWSQISRMLLGKFARRPRAGFPPPPPPIKIRVTLPSPSKYSI